MKHLSLLLFVVLISLYACKKEDLLPDIGTAEDVAAAEDAYSGTFTIIDEIVRGVEEDTLNGGANFSNCANIAVTLDGGGLFVSEIVVDYGTTGCVDNDGKTRKGILTITLNARYGLPGTLVTTTTSGFEAKNNQISGMLTIKNDSINSAGNLSFTMTVSGGSVTYSKGTVTWNSTRTIELTAGASTFADPSDDAWSITGNANGTNRLGKNFELNTTAPLLLSTSCDNITKGIVQLIPEDQSTQTIDFGDGTCDNKATLSYGSFSNIPIQL